MGYCKVVGMNTGLIEESVFDMLHEEFSDIFALPSENRDCTVRSLDRSYREAKGAIPA